MILSWFFIIYPNDPYILFAFFFEQVFLISQKNDERSKGLKINACELRPLLNILFKKYIFIKKKKSVFIMCDCVCLGILDSSEKKLIFN